MNCATRQYWRRMAIGVLIASAVVLFLFSDAGIHTPAAQLAADYGIALLFSVCIAPLLGVLMPRLAPWVWRHSRYPFNWLLLSAIMAVVAFAGSVVAIGILEALGAIRPDAFVGWLERSTRVAIAITLTIGIFMTAYALMRSRLAQASAAARLASLESRVQPHFLFNTLNSIAALVYDDPAGAERMTTKLASLMRSALDTSGDPLVPIDEELRVVRDYLEIEQVRFRDRLRFDIVCEPSAAGAMVPRLSIQTLVENAVKFAVTPAPAGSGVRVRAAAAGRRVTVTVEDDGPGFASTALPDGHGLALLRSRLELLFGSGASLRITGARPTRVELDLPLADPDDAPGRRFDPLAASRLA